MYVLSCRNLEMPGHFVLKRLMVYDRSSKPSLSAMPVHGRETTENHRYFFCKFTKQI